MGMTVTRVRFDASLVRMSATGTTGTSTAALCRIVEGSRADRGQCVASMSLTQQLAFAGVTMNFGPSGTPISGLVKPHQRPGLCERVSDKRGMTRTCRLGRRRATLLLKPDPRVTVMRQNGTVPCRLDCAGSRLAGVRQTGRRRWPKSGSNAVLVAAGQRALGCSGPARSGTD